MPDEITPEHNAHRTATSLALLTILKDRVTDEIAKLRAEIETSWSGGTRVTFDIDGDDGDRIPLGTIRADPLTGTARVADPDAWLQWCRDAQPHNVRHEHIPGMRTGWALNQDSRDALTDAITATNLQTSTRFDAEPAETFLAELEARGYTLTPVQQTEPAERDVIEPAFEAETLRWTLEARTPVAPGGLIPDGIEYVPPARPVKPVVTIKPDKRARREFVHQHATRLTELTGQISTDPKEARNGG